MDEHGTGTSAIVLAGGKATRMGGLDKGLHRLAGRPLIAWVLERLAPQADEILISANRNIEQYAAFGWPVVRDREERFEGPLAGMQAGCRAARLAWILTVPCDAPRLPLDLAARLRGALACTAAACAVASIDGRRQPVFALFRRSLGARLDAFLAAGGRAVHAWQDAIGAIEVPFDDPAAFAALNTSEAMAALEQTSGR